MQDTAKSLAEMGSFKKEATRVTDLTDEEIVALSGFLAVWKTENCVDYEINQTTYHMSPQLHTAWAQAPGDEKKGSRKEWRPSDSTFDSV